MSDLICIEDFVPKDQYELDEILQNENGLSMRFSGEYRTIVIEYGYRWIWYSSSDEADRWKTFRKYFGDRNCVETGLFYILNNSKLKKWIIDEKYGVWNEDKLEHQIYVALNDIIEIIATDRPKASIIEEIGK